jgi:hypothetical protein
VGAKWLQKLAVELYKDIYYNYNKSTMVCPILKSSGHMGLSDIVTGSICFAQNKCQDHIRNALLFVV